VCDYQTGFGLVNGFIDHTPLGTSSNYSAIADLHTLQITIPHIESSPACSVFNSRFLVKDINSGGSSASRAQVLPVWRISRNWTLSVPPESESMSELLYRLAPSPLRPTTSIFFQLNPCGRSPYVTSSLTREWVCRLQLLLVLANSVILWSESRETHDHILLSQI
jgi:hypothetical protein